MTDRPSDRAIAWMPGLRTRSAPTNSAEISDTDNIVEIANSLGYYHCTRVALVVVND